MKFSRRITARTIRWRVPLALLTPVIVMFAVSACGSATPVAAPPSSTAAPAATQAPTGTATPAPTLTPAANPNPGGLFPLSDYKPFPGPLQIFEMKFSEDGTFVYMLLTSVQVTEVITGVYVVTGDKIVLTENPGGPCSRIPETFTWSFDGKTLRLKPSEDNACPFVSQNLGRQWVKQP